MTAGRVSDVERLRRWRLVLGGGDADGTAIRLAGDDQRIDDSAKEARHRQPRDEAQQPGMDQHLRA